MIIIIIIISATIKLTSFKLCPDDNFHWTLPVHTSFGDLDLILMSQWCWKGQTKSVFSVSSDPICSNFVQLFTWMDKITHSMLFVTLICTLGRFLMWFQCAAVYDKNNFFNIVSFLETEKNLSTLHDNNFLRTLHCIGSFDDLILTYIKSWQQNQKYPNVFSGKFWSNWIEFRLCVVS